MKLFTLIVLAAFARNVYAQDTNYQHHDFSQVAVDAIDTEKLQQSVDSIWNAVLSDSVIQLYGYVMKNKSRSGYVSFDIGYESSTASLAHLNSELQSAGFGEVTEIFGSVPWGISVKRNRWLFTYLLAPGIANGTTTDEYDLKVEGMTMDVTAGYDLLNLKRFQIYPQLRLGLQEFDINVVRTAAPRDITGVNELVSNMAETTLEKTSLPLTYGLEADYHLLHSEGSGGIILAFKYGLTTDLARGKWKMNGDSAAFSSPDRIRESSFTALLRIYLKN